MAASSAVEPLAKRPERRASRPLPQHPAPAIAAIPLRVRGRIGDGLDGALMQAGLSPAAASDFLRILSGKLNLARDVGPDDHFDLVMASLPAADGAHEGALLYAAVDRVGASDVRLMRWGGGRRGGWVDTAFAEGRSRTMTWPVAGRVSSAFGLRYHPILHFARMHRGVDFAASRGQPIVAAADGTVVRSGWAGGYGNQVRIAHAGGLTTTYSHLGRMAVRPGASVRTGQLIGYVGSTGLSTGPHLHFEVYRGRMAVNPLSVRFGAGAPFGGAELARFRTRLGQYLALVPQLPSQG